MSNPDRDSVLRGWIINNPQKKYSEDMVLMGSNLVSERVSGPIINFGDYISINLKFPRTIVFDQGNYRIPEICSIEGTLAFIEGCPHLINGSIVHNDNNEKKKTRDFSASLV